jgi:hypothetical protein
LNHCYREEKWSRLQYPQHQFRRLCHMSYRPIQLNLHSKCNRYHLWSFQMRLV